MKISLTIIDFLILSLALQGFVLAGMLFYSAKKINSNRWLASLILLLSYSTALMEVFHSNLPNTNPLVYVFLPQLRLLLGPLLYFYTRGLLFGDKKLTRKDYLHFSPLIFELGPQIAFIFHFCGLLLIPGISRWYLPFEKQVIIFQSGNTGNLPFFFSFVIYAALCFKMVRSNYLNLEVSTFKLTDIRWLKTLLHIIFYLLITWSITIILGYLQLPQLAGIIKYTMTLLAIGFAYWLAMSAYARQSKMSASDVVEYNKPPVKIYFSAIEAGKYSQRLISLMEDDRVYLNPALKLDFLAAQIGISEKLMSNLLNQHVGKNFNDFVNEYRIQEARKKLNDPTTVRQFTIAAIAFDCGFNSLATFQRCFKQFTGTTPSQYQNGSKSNPLQTNIPQIPI